MAAYIVRRLLWLPVVLVAVSFLAFAIARFGPGDPVAVAAGQYRDPEILERIRAERKRLGAPPSGRTSSLDPGRAGEYGSVVRFHESLEIARRNGRHAIRCVHCNHLFCGPDENYKNYALRRVVDLNDYMDDALPSGEPYIGEYHEYSCPGCQVQLQVDLFCPPMGGDPILWDTRIDV